MNPTPTQKMLAKMLSENTGTHFLDSGMAYGRHWQQNQGKTVKDWISSDSASLDRFGYTRNVFHFLDGIVTYRPDLDKIFRKNLTLDDYWSEEIENFLDKINARGPYFHDQAPFSENSYNGESNLSQVIQFWLFTLPEDRDVKVKRTVYTIPAGSYCFLQIHGGADVRGGYTSPRWFECDSEDYIVCFADGYIACEGSLPDVAPGQIDMEGVVTQPERTIHSFYTDDSWNWYDNESSEKFRLEDFPRDEDSDDILCVKCGRKMVPA